MASTADDFRALMVSFETWVRTAPTALERRDFLEMARTMRDAVAELDASAATVKRALKRRVGT
jgi:hypothetical protein